MNFLPAPPNTGVRFRRVDLEGKPEIEARVENVSETNRSTTLAKGNTRIHTVEHVLARDYIRLCFAYYEPERLAEGIAHLARALE